MARGTRYTALSTIIKRKRTSKYVDLMALMLDKSAMDSSIEYRTKRFKRPFRNGQAVHITMRSKIAVGALSMIAVRGWLRDYLPQLAKRVGVTLYHFSNNGTHLHIVLSACSAGAQSTFLRALSGVVARKVLGAEKGKSKNIKFWTERPYSRLVTWGREFKNVMLYVQRNCLEAAGKIPYFAREVDLPKRYQDQVERSLKATQTWRDEWFSMQLPLL